MKNILVTITIFLGLLFFSLTPIYSQQNDTLTEEQIKEIMELLNEERTFEESKESEENLIEEQEIPEDIEEEDLEVEERTLDEVLKDEQEETNFPINIFQILFALIAPATFILVAYLLIKKMKL